MKHQHGDGVPQYIAGQVFGSSESPAAVNSLDFHKDGKFFVTASDDGMIELFDSLKARQRKVAKSTSRGARLIQCTHHEQAVVYANARATAASGSAPASSVGDINYHSLYDNRYIRHYAGNEGETLSLAMSPVDDTFLSTSADCALRLWDLRENHAVGMARLPPQNVTSVSAVPARSSVAYDPSGKIFALWTHDATLRLYDSANWAPGPFQTWHLSPSVRGAGGAHKAIDRALGTGVERLLFSPNGELMLLVTSGSDMVLVKSYDDTEDLTEPPIKVLRGRQRGRSVAQGSPALPLGVGFSPDSKWILGGSECGKTLLWSSAGEPASASATPVEESPADVLRMHRAPVRALAWNPRYDCFATAASKTVLWRRDGTESAAEEGAGASGGT